MNWIERNSTKRRHKLKGLPCPLQVALTVYGSIKLWSIRKYLSRKCFCRRNNNYALFASLFCGSSECAACAGLRLQDETDSLRCLQRATIHRHLCGCCAPFALAWRLRRQLETGNSSPVPGRGERGNVNCAFQIIWLIINRTWRSILESRDTIPQSPSSCS